MGYESGNKTKNEIVKAAKKLFYKKGLNKTTYADICKEVGIQQGNLHYHYNNKFLLGKIVSDDSNDTIAKEVNSLISNAEDDNFLTFTLNMFVFEYKTFKDKNYWRFTCEFLNEYIKRNINIEIFDYYFNSMGFPLHSKKEISKTDKLRQLSCIAIDTVFSQFLFDNRDEYSYDEIATYLIRTYALLLNLDKKQIERSILKATEIMQTSDLSILKTQFI